MKKTMIYLMATVLFVVLLCCGCGKKSDKKNSEEEITFQAEPSVDYFVEQPEDTMPVPGTTPEAEPETTPEPENEPEPIVPDKLIALSFDDGPSSTTLQILDILEENDAVATFFLIGQNIPGNESIVEREVELGCEIANHSYTYDAMDQMSTSEIQDSISKTSALIEEITGEAPSFFRPPNIALSNTMYEAIDLPFICGIGCNDWVPSQTAKQRTASVLRDAKDGAIILLHDLYGNVNTVTALPDIIKGLREKGYEFVTISELFARKGVDPNVEYKIWTIVE